MPSCMNDCFLTPKGVVLRFGGGNFLMAVTKSQRSNFDCPIPQKPLDTNNGGNF